MAMISWVLVRRHSVSYGAETKCREPIYIADISSRRFSNAYSGLIYQMEFYRLIDFLRGLIVYVDYDGSILTNIIR